MYILNLSKLEVGDIFLISRDDPKSEKIKKLTQCDYTHAALYTNRGSYIDSDGLGVQSGNTQRLLFKNEDEIKVLRLKDDIYKSLITEVINYTRRKIGTEFSGSEVRNTFINKSTLPQEPNRQFCSRLVAQAYQYAGIYLVDNPNYCSPKEILDSKLLIEIEEPLIKASQADIEFAESDNVSLGQRDIIFNILEKVKNLTNKDIQTFGQLSEFVLNNPDKENKISQILEESGYLTMWKIEKERNPHHYNSMLFLAYYRTMQDIKAAAKVLRVENREVKARMIENFNTVVYNYSHRKQRYFYLHIKLYKKLIELCDIREMTVKKALNLIGENDNA